MLRALYSGLSLHAVNLTFLRTKVVRKLIEAQNLWNFQGINQRVLLRISSTMGAAFSPEKPLKEIVRENQRMIKKAIREMEKEISNLKIQEKKLIADIKKSAKANEMVDCFMYITWGSKLSISAVWW